MHFFLGALRARIGITDIAIIVAPILWLGINFSSLTTVDWEIFARILFSQIALKDILVM